VECPQYGTRLKALGCLCDCLSGSVQRQQVIKVIWHKALRCRRRMVQCYSTGDATCPSVRAHWRHLANTTELVHPSAHWSPQLIRQMYCSVAFAQLIAESAYTLQWAPLSARIGPSHGDLDLPCNTRCFRPIRVQNSNGTSIGSAVFAQMTAECLYTLQWFACFPSKLPLLMLASGPHGTLGPPESGRQMAT